MLYPGCHGDEDRHAKYLRICTSQVLAFGIEQGICIRLNSRVIAVYAGDFINRFVSSPRSRLINISTDSENRFN